MQIGPDDRENTRRLRLEALEDRHMLACIANQSTPIAISSSATGEILTAGDSICFSFSATGNDTYNLETIPGSLADTTITLFDRDGTTQLDFDDDGGFNGDARINWTAPTSGTYFVEIRDMGDNDTGTFTLDFFDDHGGSSAQATPVSIGELVPGEIEQSSDFDFFSFTANSGTSYIVTVDNGSVGDPEVVLFDQDGLTQLDIAFSNGAPTVLAFSPPASGTFFLSVVDRGNNGTGTFSVLINESVDDHGNNIANASPMPANTFTASIEAQGDVDFFSFSATAGNLYFVEAYSPTTQTFASLVTVYDTDGTQLETGPDRVAWVAPSTGNYFIEVGNRQNQTGNYILDVDSIFYVDDHGNSAAAATNIFLPNSSSGENELSGDLDFFSFNAAAGEVYLIQTNSSSPTVANPDVRVYDTDGITSLANGSPAFTWTAPSSGNFFLSVGGGSSTGSYTLDVGPVVDDFGDDATAATVIGAPASIAGSIDFPGDTDFVSFIATAGETYIAQMSAAFNGRIEIYDTDGLTPLANSTSTLSWTAPSAGMYFAKLTSVTNTIGPYTLDINVAIDDHGNDIASASTLPSSAFAATLEITGDVDFFSFSATPGGRYRLGVSASFIRPQLTIFDSTGSQIITRTDLLEWWAPPSGGPHFVSVSTFASAAGTYILDVDELFYADDHGNAPSTATALTLPHSSIGSIEIVGDRDLLSFNATAGDIHVLETDSFITMAVFDTDGVTELTNGNLFTWTAPASGTYFIEIRDDDDNQTAIYTLDVEVAVDDFGNDAANASPLGALPTSVTGSIDYQPDSDFFSFAATAGEAYQIRTTSAFNTTPTLYDTDGVTTLISDTTPSTWVAPTTGTYFIETRGNGLGGYTLDVLVPADDFGNTIATASPLGALPAMINGVIDFQGDTDFFSLNATAGEVYLINVMSTFGVLNIFDANGGIVLTGSTALTWTVSSTGTYFIEHSVFNNNIVAYTLDVALAVDDFGNDAATASPLGALPAMINGSIDYQGDTDFFSLNATMGEVYLINVNSPFSGILNIFDASGSSVLTGSAALTWTVPSTGMYFIEYRDLGDNQTGAYSLDVALAVDDFGNDAATALSLISLPAFFIGKIDYLGDTDFFSFSATAGEAYRIDAISTAGSTDTITLYDTDGVSVLSSSNTEFVWTAPSTGAYFVEVEVFGSNGIYTMDISVVVDDFGNDAANASPLGALPTSITGSVDYIGDADFFSFDALAGIPYQINATSAFTDATLLYDTDGTTVLISDTTNATWIAPTTGTYFIEARVMGIGAYTLDVVVPADDAGNNSANATALGSLPVSITGSIEVVGDRDFYSFNAIGGENYTLEINHGTVGDPEVRLYDQDGTTQLDASTNLGGPVIIQFAPTATATGTYFIEVRDTGDDGTSFYTISVNRDGSSACDLAGISGCNLDDIDALYAGSPTPAMVQDWLTAASDASNPLRQTSTTQYVFGDTNLDGNVDNGDLGRLLNDFGDPARTKWVDGNLNGDSAVDSTDLGLLLGNFGFQSPIAAAGSAAVPAPTFSWQSWEELDSEDETAFAVIDHVFSDDENV